MVWEKAIKDQVDLLKSSKSSVIHTLPASKEVVQWQTLWEEVLRLYHFLKESGLKEGDILTIYGNKKESLVALLACSIGKWTYCPLPDNRTIHKHFGSFEVSESYKKVFYFEFKGTSISLGSLPKQWVFVEKMKEPIILLRTSGTRRGRWVAYEAEAVLQQIKSHLKVLLPQPKSTRLQILPTYHTFGLVLDLLLGFFACQTLHLFETRLTRSFLTPILKEPSTQSLALVPRILQLLTWELKGKKDQISPKLSIHVGGARVSPSLEKEAKEIFPHYVEGYGLTECGPGVLMGGLPLDCELKLEEIQGSKLKRLWVKSPTLGVWEEQETELLEGYYNTGDLVETNRDYIKVIGREDRMLKTIDGKWISLDEAAKKLETTFALPFCQIEFGARGQLVIHLGSNDQLLVKPLFSFLKKAFSFELEAQFHGDFEVLALQMERTKSKGILTLESLKPQKIVTTVKKH